MRLFTCKPVRMYPMEMMITSEALRGTKKSSAASYLPYSTTRTMAEICRTTTANKSAKSVTASMMVRDKFNRKMNMYTVKSQAFSLRIGSPKRTPNSATKTSRSHSYALKCVWIKRHESMQCSVVQLLSCYSLIRVQLFPRTQVTLEPSLYHSRKTQ
jgi:hypothetical protein